MQLDLFDFANFLEADEVDECKNNIFSLQQAALNSLLSPGFRESASLCSINGKLYLYGGLGEQIHSDIHVYDLKYQEWSKVEFTGSNFPKIGMFGHVAMTYKDTNMIVFGGQSYFSFKMKSRLCFNEVWLFNTVSLTWQILAGYGTIPVQLRNHSAVIRENMMISLGGIDSNEQYIQCLYTFSLGRWIVQIMK